MSIPIINHASKLDAVNCDWWIISNYSGEILLAATNETAAGLGLRVIRDNLDEYGVPSLDWVSVIDRRPVLTGAPLTSRDVMNAADFAEYLAVMS